MKFLSLLSVVFFCQSAFCDEQTAELMELIHNLEDHSEASGTELNSFLVAAGDEEATAALINRVDEEHQMTPLQYAILHRAEPSAVRMLLEYGGDMAITDAEGQTGLHYAALTNFEDTTQAILDFIGEEPSYVDDVNNFGQTALHMAVRNPSQWDLIRELHRLRANPFILDPERTAFEIAREPGHEGALEILLDEYRLIAHEAVIEDDLELLGQAIESNFGVHEFDAYGYLPVHEAAHLGRVDALEMLVRAFPEMLEIPDREGNSPLVRAIYANQHETVFRLLALGANPMLAVDQFDLVFEEIAYSEGHSELGDALRDYRQQFNFLGVLNFAVSATQATILNVMAMAHNYVFEIGNNLANLYMAYIAFQTNKKDSQRISMGCGWECRKWRRWL